MKKLAGAKPITVLTAYDFNTARALKASGIDMVLVGDSLSMVGLGYKDTTQVSIEEMLMCTAAVARGIRHCDPESSDVIASESKQSSDIPTLIADIPYAVIASESKQAPNIDNIIIQVERFIQAGATVVKIENARPQTLELIRRLHSKNICVMGHIGYTPQDIELFKDQKIIRDAESLMRDALSLVEAGVESMVLEMIPANIARDITERITVPTIGIGSGPYTNGQVLVTDDLLGRYNLIQPKFLRRYAQQYDETVMAISNYIKDVQSGEYPSPSESYN